MAWIDCNGRLFGRVNLIDAALLVFVLVLIPIGVATSRVFRERPLRIDSVAPKSQPVGPARRLRVKGANFRPYLRAFVNRAGVPFAFVAHNPDLAEAQFLIESPTEVEIQLPVLAPGSYDLYLLDETRVALAQLSAFAIEPPRVEAVQAVVQFLAVGDIAALARTGDTDVAGAVIQSLDGPSKTASAVLSYALPGGRGTLAVTGPARTLDAHLSIPATPSEGGVLMYRD